MSADPEEWSYDTLWQKAKLYVQRALAEDRNGPLFPFWASLSLELLARATLASVHPVLLADPQDGKNILHAVGYPSPEHLPRSVPAKTVFSRCVVVIPEFTKVDFELAMALVERRNAELHSGAPAFDNFPSRLWVVDFFRICVLLLQYCDLTAADLFGRDEAEAAEKMVAGAREALVADVRSRIDDHRVAYEGQGREDSAGAKLAAIRATIPGPLESRAACPACGLLALLSGEQVGADEPRLDEDEIVVVRTVLPTLLSCPTCGLTLKGYAEVHAAQLGGQFTSEERWDPAEYYGPDIDELVAQYEPDYSEYMNE